MTTIEEGSGNLLTFIINPTAGNGYALQVEQQMRKELEQHNIAYQIMHTEKPGHAQELAAAAAADPLCKGVIAVGGDGTAYETACGLLGTSIPLGIIPAGTGNDFIKTVNIPKEPLEALRLILKGKARPVDIGRMNDRIFLNVCGTGFDVTVLDYTEQAKKYVRGIFPYLIGLVRAIRHYKPVQVHFTADGKTQEQPVLICSVANGRFIGGGLAICPDAKADDGQFDMVVVEHIPRWRIPGYIPGLLMGKVLSWKVTNHRRCSKVEIISKGMRLNVDGEILTMDKAEFEILPGKLQLFW